MTELAKTFEPGVIEARWYAHWEASGQFRPERLDATPFTIVMPPPNVTGSLHIGHALDVTLQDILTRHARLQGKDALWVVGTDHAGIATQMVVERNLDSQGIKRAEIGREAFLEHVWEWKAQSGGQITQQLRRLGASCDWANERFTMDEGFSKAVTHVFVELHKRGLLYRDKRLVNWDPKFQTAISDLEVEQREVNGKFWHFRYPLEDGSGFIAIATTRPETILGDGAVAVHPDDPKYAHLVGKRCLLPIVDRLIPIITDAHVRMDFGSGAVKITAAHDWNDYEVALRHPAANIPFINLLNADATMSDNCPPEYRGLDRYQAREKVVADFTVRGLLDKVEDHVHMVPFGDRSGVVIEPWLTDQWYVDAKTLAQPAIEAVKSGAIKIVPETWAKTWFNWLENIQPWCVSRQLWWGHRIPAWYGPKDRGIGIPAPGESWANASTAFDETFVAETEQDAKQAAASYYSEQVGEREIVVCADRGEALWKVLSKEIDVERQRPIWRDNDVLDTWFSSALWPFATLGWPEQTEDLKRHYPNDVLISGFDILFFWDARMAMQGIEFMKEVPWKTLYLHGLVRDAAGQKMSKSKGNTVDPLGLIDRFGADALRFTMAAMESQGRDIKLDEKRVEGYRNFATKLWNAARFLQGNGVGASTSIKAPDATLPVNRWIIGEVVDTLAKLDKAFAELRFDDMADAIYHFTWGSFCDWYVEFIKGVVSPFPQAGGEEPRSGEGVGASEGATSPTPNPSREREGSEETKAVAAWAFDQILVMLHPLMPFITEELWHSMGERPYDLIVAKWPEPEAQRDLPATAAIDGLIAIVTEVRAVRAELNIPWTAILVPHVIGGDAAMTDRLTSNAATLSRMAKLGAPVAAASVPAGSAQIGVSGTTIAFPLEGAIDLDTEKARLAKAIAAAEKDRDGLAARLANSAFAERAKPEAVAKAREDHDSRASEAERLAAALARLG
ncbi:MAG: valine--tRNA ligase [Sphingomonas sp.]|uniref:valine--tRNA ligase n=1 Tax=Sphingomonas sp. TaxID=28214 RepID=UPI001830FC0E|nr:valine--tRNA ligase [Sphingomonas sp.]MBA3666959.1 valine--tRNA ligase [Sphingomonas sp.]